ncbi:MAG TPA: pyridoxal phosphate-dependent aminotransferase, partial [Thermodesulfobacteriota bacterium]|nr:pyridoxal phosphate-dependent aminotransferase [Thermodesulfobacteriota bacterium]
MPIADKIRDFIDRASWIRRMFEEGRQMKTQYGEENVFDFSLGNPILEPPSKFTETLIQVAQNKTPGRHV